MTDKIMTIEWERIGRNHSVPPFARRFDDDDPDSIELLCEAIDAAIRPYLSSGFFGWTCSIEGGRITIEGGRSGRGLAVVTDGEMS